MFRLLLLLLLGATSAFAAVSAHVAEGNPTTFELGEEVFISVVIDGVTDKSPRNNDGTYILEKVSTDMQWLVAQSRPPKDDGLVDGHWQNNQKSWMELSGKAPSTGNYTIKFKVKNTKNNESSGELSFSFSVGEPSQNGLTVMMFDPAASYDRQIEIRSRLKNTSANTLVLHKPYIDYYATKEHNKQAVVNVWAKPSNSCVQILRCGGDGSDNFIIRHRYSDDVSIDGKGEGGTFQVGYNEITNETDHYLYDILPEKRSSAATGAFVDYSYGPAIANYAQKAEKRNLVYNDKEALYDENGNRLWGSAPEWYNSSCEVVDVTTDLQLNPNAFRTNNKNVFCKTDSKIQIIFDTPSDTIYEGEDYFAMPRVVSSDAEIQSLEITDMSDFDWLETGTPADYWDIYKGVTLNLSGYAKMFYVRSRNWYVRQRSNLPPNEYTYVLKARDRNGNTTSVTRKVYIREGSLYAADKGLDNQIEKGYQLAILLGDETWFKTTQLDLAIGIENYASAGTFHFKDGFYFDYYGQFSEGTIHSEFNHPQLWYADSGITQTFYNCGNNQFRIRYSFHWHATRWVSFKQNVFDIKTGIVYPSQLDLNKSDDYSMQAFVENGILDLHRRRYNPYMPLYDGDSTLLWGVAPEWAQNCVAYDPSLPDTVIFVEDDEPDVFKDLKIRSYENSYDPQSIQLNTGIVNKGNKKVSLKNYEIRFYYNSVDGYDAKDVRYAQYNPQQFVFEKRRCDVDKYALIYKLADDASIDANGEYPLYGNSIYGAFSDTNWKPLDFSVFKSLNNSSSWEENPKMALFDGEGNLVYGTELWPCDGYTEKELKLSVEEKIALDWLTGHVRLKIRNEGDSSLAGPVFVNYYTTHQAGQVPVLFIDSDTISVNGVRKIIGDTLAITRISSGNKHTFSFELINGIPASSNIKIDFYLFDQCLYDCPDILSSFFKWNFLDDWSAKDFIDGNNLITNAKVTEKVTIHSSTGDILYGTPDPSSPLLLIDNRLSGPEIGLTHPRGPAPSQKANRTDAVAYSGGQLLSGGDFETEWIQGWDTAGTVSSIDKDSPQGSRHIKLTNGASIAQNLPLMANKLLSDSGATFTVWLRNGGLSVKLLRDNGEIVSHWINNSTQKWQQETVPFSKDLFTAFGIYSIVIVAAGNTELDDATLHPSSKAQYLNYLVRFTTTSGEEIETRAYDGKEELLVTDSERDAMGRSWKKYLPFALPCKDATDCNSEAKTAHNKGMAASYYTAKNKDYPDAGDFPFVETQWKPDPMATKDIEGAPGEAYSINEGHVVRVYTSGVNLSGIDLLNRASLKSAVSAQSDTRVYGGTTYHALRDFAPTHLWELTIDQDNRKAFSVKDGESRVIVSGSLDSENDTLLTWTVNELDSRGNVIKSHPPLSCAYTPVPANCVAPNTYVYDSQSRLISSWEPDADTSRSFYDLMGRLRATQTRRQIDNKTASVLIYDHLDRVVATGEWKHNKDESGLRTALLSDESKQENKGKFPSENDLTPGTITRTFYDNMPTLDTVAYLGVQLFPAGVRPKYTLGRVIAVVSDVYACSADDGTPLQMANGADSVIRVSSANLYDKYGRVLATYTFDPTMPADSLKMHAVVNEYDIGGKLISTAKYPYGYDGQALTRAITERFVYDRLGRIDSVFSKSGGNEVLLARYEYYPTGSVKTIYMGNALKLSYTYHISGAVKTAKVTTANGAEYYSETLNYEDCGEGECTSQYNGNISRMVHRLAHDNRNFVQNREILYTYDQLNRLIRADDLSQDYFDDIFEYDAQGRITAQRRAERADSAHGGEYAYKSGTNQLVSVADGIGGTADGRNMGESDNFVYDSEGNLIEDKSKSLKISYDWRGMPVEFIRETCTDYNGYVVCDSTKLIVAYDGSGRRISKTRLKKTAFDGPWYAEHVTHYTGIGTEVRENLAASVPVTQVVVNMPQGLGRYGIESAGNPGTGAKSFEWYLKNHLGSTMLVYGTGAGTPGGLKAAYDYRSFGEQIELTSPSTGKVTENFTGKERDDETQLDYFGARYLDPMLGMWISVDPARQFSSPYLYAGNGVNPVNGVDPDGDKYIKVAIYYNRDGKNNPVDPKKLAEWVKEEISSQIDMSVNTVEVKAFAEGSTTELEMTSWLNLGQPDLPAIMTHGGKGFEFVSDVPVVTEESKIDYEALNSRLKTKTYLGACYAKDNLEAANGKYDKLYGPEQYGITTNPITVEYLVKNADVAPKKDEE